MVTEAKSTAVREHTHKLCVNQCLHPPFNRCREANAALEVRYVC